MSTRRGRSPAFTVVELLVVVAVIGAITATVMSVYARARAKGWQASCLSNVRQLWASSLLYAQDNDGYLPVHRNVRDAVCCGGTSDGSQGYCDPEAMVAALGPYVKDTAIWFCREDQYAGRIDTAWCVDHLHSSYWFNFRRGWRNGLMRLRDTGLQRRRGTGSPAEYMLVADPNHEPPGRGWPSGGNHFGGCNTAYLDGHARWRPNSR